MLLSIRNGDCTRFATGSKDGIIKIWERPARQCVLNLTQHKDAITCIKWGGDGFIYTAARDRTIKVWYASDVSRRLRAIVCV
jgi:ribosome assembly protein 4